MTFSLQRERADIIAKGVAFALIATGSLGRSPTWPAPIVWATLGYLASVTSFWLAFSYSARALRWVTVTVTVTAASRIIGNAVAGSGWTRISAVGVWLLVLAYARIAHRRQRERVG